MTITRATYRDTEFVSDELYTNHTVYSTMASPRQWTIFRLSRIEPITFGAYHGQTHRFYFTPALVLTQGVVVVDGHHDVMTYVTAEPMNWVRCSLVDLCEFRSKLDFFINEEAKKRGAR